VSDLCRWCVEETPPTSRRVASAHAMRQVRAIVSESNRVFHPVEGVLVTGCSP